MIVQNRKPCSFSITSKCRQENILKFAYLHLYTLYMHALYLDSVDTNTKGDNAHAESSNTKYINQENGRRLFPSLYLHKSILLSV